MTNAYFKVPRPDNEPILSYKPGSPERIALKRELEYQSRQKVAIPLIIGGKKIWTDKTRTIVMPHKHNHVLAEYSVAGEKELKLAVGSALAAKEKWETMPWEHRAAIFLRAADLISGPRRYQLNAATMLGQSKTVFQAEIDSACELIDFLRFNVYYAEQIYRQQPNNAPGVWNRETYRPLEGFIAAVTPFNFTAIGGNLATAPAIVGNTVVWKPSSTAVLSNYFVMLLLLEAGLPAGVINFVPSAGSDISKYVISHPQLAGFHFTGSTEVFQSTWEQVGRNIRSYASYPRLVGETGGKDFVFAHPSAHVDALVAALIRGAYEYQGQKCSAASRAFIPASIWPQVKSRLLEEISNLKTGDVADFTNFIGAVIDRNSYDRIVGYIKDAKNSPDAEVLCGSYDDSTGYFIQPTLIQAHKPDYKTMVEEIFGPVLSVYVYDDAALEETLAVCDRATPYALTGSIFAEDRQALVMMERALCQPLRSNTRLWPKNSPSKQGRACNG